VARNITVNIRTSLSTSAGESRGLKLNVAKLLFPAGKTAQSQPRQHNHGHQSRLKQHASGATAEPVGCKLTTVIEGVEDCNIGDVLVFQCSQSVLLSGVKHTCTLLDRSATLTPTTSVVINVSPYLLSPRSPAK